MLSFTETIRKYDLKFDENREMDISYGEEFLKIHNVTTFKNDKTIFSDARLKKLFNVILREGIENKATDILIRPEQGLGIVYNRRGRKMTPQRIIHEGAVESLITYMRKLCGVNPEAIKIGVSTKYTYPYKTKDDIINYDTRLQFHPTNYGSSAGIRIFYEDSLNRSVDDLGFADVITYNYKNALKLREGLILVSGPTGSGKALDVNTDIPLSNGGFKKLKDILIDDIILNELGKPTKVKAIYEHENNDCFRIIFNDNNEVIADNDHNWLVHINDSKRVITTSQLREIVGKEKIKIPLSKAVEYPSKKTRYSPYILGFALGICEDTHTFKQEFFPSEEVSQESFLFEENGKVEFMIDDNYLYNDIHFRFELFRGILEGNRKLQQKYGHVLESSSFYTEHQRFFTQVKQLGESLGYFVREEISDTGNMFFLEDTEFREVVSVDVVESVPTRCLTVDSPSHLFLCGRNYLVTHNTTTEYVGILQILNDSQYTSNIFTIEDPIEYKIEGITQAEVDEVNGFTFGEATKSFLRMNPDVILVGEIRDDETAKTVTRASTSGHLAISTVHANSTLEVLDVLKQYGVHPNDIINAVKLVLFQVLEDKLCIHCRQHKILKPHQKKWLDSKLIGREQLASVYSKNEKGCSHCNYTGINGRVMLNEMLVTGFEFRVLKDLHGNNLDSLKHALMNSEDKLYYPIEWDIHRRIKEGDIDFETATRLIH